MYKTHKHRQQSKRLTRGCCGVVGPLPDRLRTSWRGGARGLLKSPAACSSTRVGSAQGSHEAAGLPQ
jgi:hypothetical protein